MRRQHALLPLILVLGAASAGGAEKHKPVDVNWHTDVAHAWQQTQQKRRPLLIFVTHQNCIFCTKMKKGTLRDGKIAAKIDGNFVPLVIDGADDCPLLKELNVKAYPATFVVSPEAVILDRIDGYVTADILAKRLAQQKPSSQLARTR
jgi:protein disulfide-isomerase